MSNSNDFTRLRGVPPDAPEWVVRVLKTLEIKITEMRLRDFTTEELLIELQNRQHEEVVQEWKSLNAATRRTAEEWQSDFNVN